MNTENRGLLYAAAGTGLLIAAGLLLRRREDYDFREKTVLITGGSRGLGLVLAREAAVRGARVAICARDRTELDRAAEDLAALGASVITSVCDVTRQEQVEAMVESVIEQAGSIDVLINNAGIVQVGPIETMTLADYREAMNVHFWGPLYTTTAVLPHMRKAGSGRIANVASIGGLISVPHLVPYSASKFALVGLSRGLRSELARSGIKVTTICPGLMRTGSPRNALFKGQNRKEYLWFNLADSQPLTAISADRAARQMLDAIARGDAELVVSTQAKLAAKLDALMPELSSKAMEWANQALPDPDGEGQRARRGFESETPLSESFLTAPGKEAARRNNQL
jgi:NAD(P)-dependent dehydrogenase (short-subunit alcohol dehydrogenase family)